MRNVSRAYAVEAGGVVPDSELSPAARAILERLARCAYLHDQHRLAMVKLSLEVSKLRGDLERIQAAR